MTDPFIIVVQSKGIERQFEAELEIIGYTHRFRVALAEGVEVFFERDEEGHYRAILPPESQENARHTFTDTALLKAIAEKIEEILE